MSSFMVEDETINKVMARLEWDEYDANSWGTTRSILQERGYDMTLPESRERLANDMFALNIAAVEARYGVGEAAKFRPLDYKYHSIATPTIYQALKSLQCLTYQCSEGAVAEMRLYKALRDIEFAWCRQIVSRLPEYETAGWS